jgi:hypothetical protein
MQGTAREGMNKFLGDKVELRSIVNTIVRDKSTAQGSRVKAIDLHIVASFVDLLSSPLFSLHTWSQL